MGRKFWAFVLIGTVAIAGACATGTLPEGDDASTGNDGSPPSDAATNKDVATTCVPACDGGVCSNGVCKAQCDSPLKQCASDAGATCVDTTSDKNHCGACTTTCTTADASGMSPGTNNPDPGIFDAGYDGGIGWTLGTATCATSQCGIDCPDAMALCTDEICYDTQNDHDHCGTCTTGCAATTEWCTVGHCCPLQNAFCGNACTNVFTDNANCGSCGHACTAQQTCGGGVCSSCVPIAGPSLTQNLGGWPTAGLRIKALKNTTLTSFEFDNQGLADTLELTDTSGTVLQTITLAANTPTYTANVSWPLTSGTSYDLVSVNGSNGHWVSYTTFPTTSASLEVDGIVNNAQSLMTTYWFSFTNLTTCP